MVTNVDQNLSDIQAGMKLANALSFVTNLYSLV